MGARTRPRTEPRCARPVTVGGGSEIRVDDVDDAVVVVDDGNDPPLVERGARVGHAQPYQFAWSDLSAAQIGVLVVDFLHCGPLEWTQRAVRSANRQRYRQPDVVGDISLAGTE